MSAVEIPEQIRRLPPEQVTELERRAAEARAHPENGRPMEDVFADIEKPYRLKQ